MEKLLLNTLLVFLKEEKEYLEKRGLIPTLDEAINDVEDKLNSI